MFELPELITLADQLNVTVQGKTISEGRLGNSPHKFVWYNRKPAEFAQLTLGKTVGEAVGEGPLALCTLRTRVYFIIGGMRRKNVIPSSRSKNTG